MRELLALLGLQVIQVRLDLRGPPVQQAHLVLPELRALRARALLALQDLIPRLQAQPG